jgi:murein DD-endopeptidase MepM/ murein hydrolase activator NlpD
MKKIWILILALIIGAVGFVYFSPMFEKNPPVIKIYTNGFTNLKNPVKIEIKDDTGIKGYKIVLVTPNMVEELMNVEEPALGKDVVLNLKLPKNINSKQIKLIIEAYDVSKWHFFAGNSSKKEIVLSIDKTSPDAQVVNNSYAIGRGGSAAVVVKVTDENLKDAYISVNGKYKFKLTPFVKDGYYVALVAWPVSEKEFSADLIAIDEAGNKSTAHIPYYWKTRGIYRQKNVKIKITDKFINNIAKRVIEKMGFDVPDDPVKAFKLVNETIRKICEDKIKKYTSNVYEDKVNGFYLNRFNPLPGSAKRADFGEIRHYYYKNEEISRAIHKGIDLAKVKRAKIYASNTGKVVTAEYIGIYGNTLIVYHKLGLYTLYGHTSEFKVKKGDIVRRGMVIARTGATGAVFGDHLHFGVYVQGIAVQPIEWMDQHWIKTNIVKVIKDARRMILK